MNINKEATPLIQYARGLALLALTYVLIYGWLLASTAFLPFVMDNNESFSSLWHASNLFHFGLGQSFGLTDESYGITAAAHPYVYTHQGNFPRLFALLIYALGARTIESQILVTTFTVGLAAIFFAYHFFSKIVSPLFALICCLLLISDYVLVAQWQVVTYRVWHEFLVFSSLLCAHGFAERRRYWPVLTLINFVCLFYYELTFVAFVSLSTAIYAAVLLRHTPRRMLGFWSLQALGGVIGLGGFALQLVLYMGWDNFLQDAYLTFMARNQYHDSAALLERMGTFFSSHNIVFWYNMADGRELRNLPYFVASITYYEFQIHTPFFTTLCWIILLGVALAYFFRGLPDIQHRMQALFERLRSVPARREKVQPARITNDSSRAAKLDVIKSIVAAAFLYASIFLLLAIVLGKSQLWGIRDQVKWYRPAGPGYAVFSLLAAAAIVAFWSMSSKAAAGSWSLRLIPRTEQIGAMVRVAFLTTLVALLIGKSEKLFNDRYAPLWLDILHSLTPETLAYAFALLCIALASWFIACHPKLLDALDLDKALPRLLTFLTAGLIAYGIVFVLSPGIVFSGYRFRIAPLTVFHIETLTALAFYVLLVFGLNGLRAAGVIGQAKLPNVNGAAAGANDGAGTNPIPGLASLLVLGFLCYYWIGTQIVYLKVLPPDHFDFMDKLSKPPYKGQSFIVNAYAAPVAAKTGNWAYLNGTLANNELELSGDDVEIPFDKRYLWFADKNSNPDYARPAYFLCITHHALSTVIEQFQRQAGEKYRHFVCEENQLVMLARDPGGIHIYPSLELVEADTEGPKTVGYERWAIVKLDWGRKPAGRAALK